MGQGWWVRMRVVIAHPTPRGGVGAAGQLVSEGCRCTCSPVTARAAEFLAVPSQWLGKSCQ
eukprot:43276-Hanusia_phi.AAC.1